jgi:hypothetical protein
MRRTSRIIEADDRIVRSRRRPVFVFQEPRWRDAARRVPGGVGDRADGTPGGSFGTGLRAVLLSKDIVSRDVQFRRKDKEASREQTWLFRILRSINWLILAIPVLRGLILAKGAFAPIAASLGWVDAFGTATT